MKTSRNTFNNLRRIRWPSCRLILSSWWSWVWMWLWLLMFQLWRLPPPLEDPHFPQSPHFHYLHPPHPRPPRPRPPPPLPYCYSHQQSPLPPPPHPLAQVSPAPCTASSPLRCSYLYHPPKAPGHHHPQSR